MSPDFVGREEELRRLDEALSHAGEGRPQALVISGEAGVGKSRLVEEFASRAAGAGAVVATGGCVEVGAEGLPFAPFSAALRTLRRSLPSEFATAADGYENELARLLPELGESIGRCHDEGEPARLFELAAQLLRRLAAGRTLVVVLEDLHWADTSTRHLLVYLLRSLDAGRLLILPTYRSDDIHRRHPLRPLLAELDRMRAVTRVGLARFNEEEVRRQLRGILGEEPAADLVREVHTRSDGNAFFVEELAATVDAGDRTCLSDSLRELLLVRVETLPEEAQRVLRLAAEGGSVIEYSLLRAVSALEEDVLLAALRAAVGAHVLQPAPEGDGYRFRHSLLREAVGDDLLPGERSQVNRRYAEALQETPGLVPEETRAGRLAGHWYHAHDPARALPAVLEASVQARRRYAYAEQLGLLERAMELWDQVPADIRAQLRPADYAEFYPPCGCDPHTTSLRFLDLMAEAAVAGRYAGERERALTITRRAQRLLEEDGEGADPLQAAWFWVQRSYLVQNLGRGDGRAELERAEALVSGLPPSPVHALVLEALTGWSVLREPGPGSIAAAERTVRFAEMVGAAHISLNARMTRGWLRVAAGDLDSGFADLQQVREEAAADGHLRILGRVYVNLPSTLESVGRSREAVAVAEEGLAIARRHGLRDTEGWIAANLAESLISCGRWDRAQETAATTARTALSAKARGGGALCLTLLALARGDHAGAGRHLAAAYAEFGARDPMPQYSLQLVRMRTGLAAAEGRILDVREETARAVAEGFPPGTHRYVWPLLVTAARAESTARNVPAAREGASAAVDLIRTAARRLAAPVPVWEAHADWVRAELADADGELAPAMWEQTESAFAVLERPFELARARLSLARSLLTDGADGERDRAAELLRRSEAVARHLGAVPLAEEAVVLARRGRLALRPPTTAPADDPAAGLGLTAREREVLHLVSAGYSNRRIGQALFISPKTVSVHVSNILAKLGVTGRGAAAATAHRLGLFTADGAGVPAVGHGTAPTPDPSR